MREIRKDTDVIVIVGVLLTKDGEGSKIPLSGAKLSDFTWKYLIPPNLVPINIINFIWGDLTYCDGCYYLIIPAAACSILGNMKLYINDPALVNPIFIEFQVVSKNYYDAKYDNSLLSVEQFAMKG